MVEFVEVLVEATGRHEQVPADWIGHPVLGKGIKKVEPTSTPVVEAPPTGEQEVQLTGPVDDLPIIPAAREAVLAARAAEAQGEVPTEDNTHDEIDAFASRAGIELGSAKTKAEKVAVINAHLATTTDTDGTESSDETPGAGEEEN